MSEPELLFYIGSYSPENLPGIALCRFDPEKNAIEVLGTFPGVKDPIYLVQHPHLPVLYSCADLEGESGVCAFSIAPDGMLSKEAVIPTKGKGCCHVSIHASGEYLAESNYGDGSLSIIRISRDGTPLECTDRVQHHGKSAHWKRQREAHVHFAAFEGDDILSCDLGEDKIYRYHLDKDTGKIREEGMQYSLSPGDGPRHLVADTTRHRIYCITEMGSNVSVFDEETGKKLQRLHSIPEDVDLRKLRVGDYDAFGAAIRQTKDGMRILSSNRGHNSISVFAVRRDGCLTRLSVTETGGIMPRDFALLGENQSDAAPPYVIAANQEAGGVTVLQFDEKREVLHQTGASLSFSSPVAILPAGLPEKAL